MHWSWTLLKGVLETVTNGESLTELAVVDCREMGLIRAIPRNIGRQVQYSIFQHANDSIMGISR